MTDYRINQLPVPVMFNNLEDVELKPLSERKVTPRSRSPRELAPIKVNITELEEDDLTDDQTTDEDTDDQITDEDLTDEDLKEFEDELDQLIKDQEVIDQDELIEDLPVNKRASPSSNFRTPLSRSQAPVTPKVPPPVPAARTQAPVTPKVPPPVPAARTQAPVTPKVPPPVPATRTQTMGKLVPTVRSQAPVPKSRTQTMRKSRVKFATDVTPGSNLRSRNKVYPATRYSDEMPEYETSITFTRVNEDFPGLKSPDKASRSVTKRSPDKASRSITKSDDSSKLKSSTTSGSTMGRSTRYAKSGDNLVPATRTKLPTRDLSAKTREIAPKRESSYDSQEPTRQISRGGMAYQAPISTRSISYQAPVHHEPHSVIPHQEPVQPAPSNISYQAPTSTHSMSYQEPVPSHSMSYQEPVPSHSMSYQEPSNMTYQKPVPSHSMSYQEPVQQTPEYTSTYEVLDESPLRRGYNYGYSTPQVPEHLKIVPESYLVPATYNNQVCGGVRSVCRENVNPCGTPSYCK